MAIRLTESKLRQIIRQEINEMGRRAMPMPVKQVVDMSGIVALTSASRPDRMYMHGGMSKLELKEKLTDICDVFACTWKLMAGGTSVEISGPDEESVQLCVDEIAAMGIG